MSNRLSYALAVLLLLLALGMRSWQLNTLPVGFSDPELAQIDLMHDTVQRGDIRVFYPYISSGQEGLYSVFLGLAELAFGGGTLGFRLLSLFAGLLTVALAYSLGQRLFGPLAGLATAGLLAVMMWASLLSRLVLVEAFVPLLVTAMLMALARAFPVYQRVRAESSNTIDFALLGVLLGLSPYLHPVGLLLVLIAMLFIAFFLVRRRSLSLRRLSYLGFTLLLFIIIAMPYLLSSVRLPELSAAVRLLGNYEHLFQAVAEGFVSLIFRGDLSALHNLPQRPLIDLMSGFLALLGVMVALRYWYRPRYALLLLAAGVLLVPAFLADNPPNFRAMSALLLPVALFFGLGFSVLVETMPRNTRLLGGVGAVLLLLFNIGWTVRDLFVQWPALEETQQAYNAPIGQTAHYLDRTADEIPTVLCDPRWNEAREINTPLYVVDKLHMHMNRSSASLRNVDCSQAFLFVNGGRLQQVVLPSEGIYDLLPPGIADWLALSRPVPGLPQEPRVLTMEVQEELADALGVYITTTPAGYITERNVSEHVPVPPPIRFGGNLTWLGYEVDPEPVYEVGSVIPVTTYWRVEGLVPSDANIFTHLLSDPVTVVANRDTMHIDPTQLQDRDVFIHIANVPLMPTTLPGRYEISVGLYQSSSNERLPVFDDMERVRGDRIFLYGVDVVESE